MMMTEMDDKFLEFSQMLDEEEHLRAESLDEDGRLLMDLRKVLRDDTTSPELPENFARETAAAVKDRFAALPWTTRLKNRFQGALGESILRKTTAAYGGALTAFGAGLWLLDARLAVIYGVLLLLGSVGWLARGGEGPGLPRLGGLHRLGFYGLPILALALTGALAGLAVAGLGSVSATFRGQDEMLTGLGVAGGIGIFTLLVLGLAPSWRALRDNHGNSGWRLLAHLGPYAVWLGIVVYGLSSVGKGWHPEDRSSLLGAIVFWALSSYLITYFVPHEGTGTRDLKRAYRRTRGSLFLSTLLLGTAVYVFYQVHLTKELLHPKRYETVMADVESWYQAQMAIPDAENGWFEIKHFMLRSEVEAGRDQGIGEKLGGLSEYYDPDLRAAGKARWNTDPEGYQKAKVAFLEELPRIERALAKPYLSYFATEAKDGLTLDIQVPNFILMRGITQGLALLQREAMEQGEKERAVRYSQLAMRWASHGEPGTLIGLMIRIAMGAILLEPLEEMILEGELSVAQLRELSRTLKTTRLSESALYGTMSREVAIIDKLMQDLKERGIEELGLYGELGGSGMELVAFLLPKSYLESERLAYLNFQLNRMDQWKQLSAPSGDVEAAINPLNIASSMFVPNLPRATAQMMYLLSKWDAHRLMVALEIYQREQGKYPDTLEVLVPDYIEELPEDMMHEAVLGRKQGFRYQTTENGYELTSTSQSYPVIRLQTTQVYGRKGDYKEER